MRLILGDCIELMREIPDGSVDLVLTDIPYGEVNRKSGGLRSLDKSDADTFDNNDLEILVSEFERVATNSIYVFCGTYQISSIMRGFAERGMTARLGAWNKTNPSPMNGSRLWVSGLEFCVYARKANAVHNEHCQKALWDAPSGKSKIHPTQKPLMLFERLVRASSNEGQTVFDPFMGSGTTGVACVNTGRQFIGIERNPQYFQIATDRINQAMTRLIPGMDLT